ncbi:MurR/RpiR family transcriptional regulator, partial [Citrobacter sp. VF227]
MSRRARADAGAVEGVVPLSGVLDRLRAVQPGLPPTAARIAGFILDHAGNVVHMSVTEVAERSAASEGSVVALCQQIGARGFQQLKLAIARDLVQPVQFIHEDLTRDDDTATVLD